MSDAMRSLAAWEVEMLRWRTAAVQRLHAAKRAVKVGPDDSIWGWGDEVSAYLDAVEAVAAFEQFPPTPWWSR